MLAFVLALCLGCTQKETPAAPLKINTDAVDFGGLGGEQKIISVTSGTDWYARSSSNWVRILSASGDGGDQPSKCRISVEDNFSGESRTGKIVFSNLGGDKAEVTVSQVSAPDPHVVRGISTVADLMSFVQAVNSEGSVAQYLVDGVVKFNTDIDCSSITEWVPIGTQDIPLIYDVDGNNKTLKNIHWSIDVSRYPMAGFIGVADNVKIRRLSLGVKGGTDKIEFTGNPADKVRAGGIVGRAQGVVMEKVTNAAALEVKGTSATGNNLIIGGLVGYSDPSSLIGGELVSTKGCRSLGDISVPVVAQAGGLVGYNSGTIQNCTFNATITCPSDGTDGPGWVCSCSKAARADIVGNSGYGFVGTTPSMMRNSMMNHRDGYDPEANTVDWTLDAYYDWTAVETRRFHPAATYYHYSCTNVPREIHVVEVDLNDPSIELVTAWAGNSNGEMIPNPNGNANNNNGFNLRERLSDVCARQRSEGKKVLAGVNAGFFDSNSGIGRGFYVEDGQPLYINNPAVVTSLANHIWGLTVFTDGTASCGTKVFSGKFKVGSNEYNFSSVNDTTLRHANADYQANLFTSHYVRQPYSSKPNIISDLAKNVLYVICQWDSDPMKVNSGYARATVKEIKDGRTSPLAVSALPYFTQKNRIGLALSGELAQAVKAAVQVGSKVDFKCDITIDGTSKPIASQVASMFQLMTAGEDASSSPPAGHTIRTAYDPKTFPVVSADRRKVWLVQVDGRDMWYSLGVKSYEMYRIGKKLGGAWVTALDGGGSSSMWAWDPSKNKGGIVGKPCDSRGERSCLNYLLVREK